MLRPSSLRRIKALSDYDWHVSQDFTKLGYPVKVQAWGFTRKDALINFDVAVEEEERIRDVDPLQGLINFCWNVAEIIDMIRRK